MRRRRGSAVPAHMRPHSCAAPHIQILAAMCRSLAEEHCTGLKILKAIVADDDSECSPLHTRHMIAFC